MSLEDKIRALQEKALQLEEAKCEDEEEDDVDGSEDDAIEDENEVKGKMKTESEEIKAIDLGALFDGVDLTEEFKAKAQTIFEAAVAVRVKQEVEQMEESLAQRAIDESVELKEGLVDKVDGYLDYVVEQWMSKNELALERGIKSEILESFVSGMKGLFEEHYINVPDEKFDILEEVEAKAQALEEQIDELTAKNVELQKSLKESVKAKKIDEATEGLSDLEAARFKELAEELTDDDVDAFGNKLQTIKENYFAKAPKAKTIVESVVTDAPVELKEETQTLDPAMARYVSALKPR